MLHLRFLGHFLPGIFLLLTTTVGCDMKWAVILMSLAVASEGFVGAGGFANNLDVSGRYAGEQDKNEVFLHLSYNTVNMLLQALHLASRIRLVVFAELWHLTLLEPLHKDR